MRPMSGVRQTPNDDVVPVSTPSASTTKSTKPYASDESDGVHVRPSSVDRRKRFH